MQGEVDLLHQLFEWPLSSFGVFKANKACPKLIVFEAFRALVALLEELVVISNLYQDLNCVLLKHPCVGQVVQLTGKLFRKRFLTCLLLLLIDFEKPLFLLG